MFKIMAIICARAHNAQFWGGAILMLSAVSLISIKNLKWFLKYFKPSKKVHCIKTPKIKDGAILSEDLKNL